MFIRFENIGDRPGLLLNIKGLQKVLFEVNGKLTFLNFENNMILRMVIEAFTDIKFEDNNFGFLYFENGYIKCCRIPSGYEIEQVGLIRRNPLFRFPVNCNILQIGTVKLYITVEKETRIVVVPNMPPSNRYIYHLVLRTEEYGIIFML